MEIIRWADFNSDDRRDLTAFRPGSEFPLLVEGKVIVVKRDGVELGNHSHSHVEGFLLVSGLCHIVTWTADGGRASQGIIAPAMFMFEKGEEHVLYCSADTILVGYMPVSYKDEHNTPAIHLSCLSDV